MFTSLCIYLGFSISSPLEECSVFDDEKIATCVMLPTSVVVGPGCNRGVCIDVAGYRMFVPWCALRVCGSISTCMDECRERVGPVT